ncbi:unnamed protein product [Pleuronectes platessa]|uniref:Uncharacterized protein n=1 Tax=Pleuronectes platessa TaxID=8262 RepID=A0A9N7W171_PLEPL|nr:unnamed protein product [Pleuronectes platessa]
MAIMPARYISPQLAEQRMRPRLLMSQHGGDLCGNKRLRLSAIADPVRPPAPSLLPPALSVTDQEQSAGPFLVAFPSTNLYSHDGLLQLWWSKLLAVHGAHLYNWPLHSTSHSEDYFQNIWLQSRRQIKAALPPSELLLPAPEQSSSLHLTSPPLDPPLQSAHCLLWAMLSL